MIDKKYFKGDPFIKTFKMQKLALDKIIDNILSDGGKVDLLKLDKKQFLIELKEKL